MGHINISEYETLQILESGISSLWGIANLMRITTRDTITNCEVKERLSAIEADLKTGLRKVIDLKLDYAKELGIK